MSNISGVGGSSGRSYNFSESPKDLTGIGLMILTILGHAWYANRSSQRISSALLSTPENTKENVLTNDVALSSGVLCSEISETALRDELVKSLPAQEQHFLDNVGKMELQKIRAAFDHSDMSALVDTIQKGKWDEFRSSFFEIDKAEKSRGQAFSILKAACCQNKITLVDLASAYMVASLGTESAHQVMPWNPAETENYEQLKWMSDVKDRVSENQKYMIVMDLRVINRTTRDVIERSFKSKEESTFYDYLPWAFPDDDHFIMPLFGFLNKHPFTEDLGFAIFRRLTPKRGDMFIRLSQKYPLSDFGLVENREQQIHGVKIGPLFQEIHDIFHWITRVKSGFLRVSELSKFGMSLEEVINKLPPYTTNNCICRNGVFRPKFLAPSYVAYSNDAVRLILENFSSIILDGELIAEVDRNLYFSTRETKLVVNLDAFVQLERMLQQSINESLGLSFSGSALAEFDKNLVSPDIREGLAQALNPILFPYGKELQFWTSGIVIGSPRNFDDVVCNFLKDEHDEKK